MLVVNPNNRLKTLLSAVETPLWAGLIASYRNADILDAEAGDLTLEQTVEAVRNSGHKDIIIVVMGNNPSVSSTPKMPVAEALADRIKDLNVSFTGLHPVAVCYDKYPVISKPFQGFPMMPWDRLPMHLYRAHNWHCLDGSPRMPYASIYTSMGCPFDCYYCNIHALYRDRQVQFRSIDNVLEEVEILVTRYQVRNIKIWDELFALKEDRVIAICEGLKDYDLNVWAYARLDLVTERMLKVMKQGGINWVAYGFENVTDLKFIAQTEDVIKMTREAGLSIIANFIFGLPGTTQDEDRQSVDFAMKHLFEFVNFYDAKPYPGSKWYNEIKERLKVMPSNGWFDQYKYKSSFRKQAFGEYFTNPDYLSMIEKKFGGQAVAQIETMLEDNINAKSKV